MIEIAKFFRKNTKQFPASEQTSFACNEQQGFLAMAEALELMQTKQLHLEQEAEALRQLLLQTLSEIK